MKLCWGLLQRRECLCLTWRGRLAVLALVALALIGMGRTTYPFLAVNDPQPGGYLIVEGWAPDYVFAAVTNEFAQNHYEKIYITGNPLDKGAPLLEYQDAADLGAATLAKMGLATNCFQAVPAPFAVRDRTYTAAITLKQMLAVQGKLPAKLNIMTLGAHARRSRMLFQRVFGNDTTIGVRPIPCRDFDEQHWWRSSPGVRVVMSELLAYGYARFIFTKPE
ncbi:MAG: YdcF family protein [Kiritimatiellaeota bacterium]|nr:YdcF family protein [Kiritimatiellota bacterium]